MEWKSKERIERPTWAVVDCRARTVSKARIPRAEGGNPDTDVRGEERASLMRSKGRKVEVGQGEMVGVRE